MPSPRRTSRPTAVQNPLETYLRDINETPLLTADDEKRLAVAIAKGDALARDHMVRANLRLVVNIARGYANRGLLLPDLIEEGNLGLLRAVEGFDPTIGTRFSTYASYWIKQSIKRALINSGKTIRIPAYMVEIGRPPGCSTRSVGRRRRRRWPGAWGWPARSSRSSRRRSTCTSRPRTWSRPRGAGRSAS